MPKVEEWCEVTANGQTYRDWTSVAVNWGYAENRGGFLTFSLVLAEPNVSRTGGQYTGALQLSPGDDVEVTMAGKKLIANGKIIVRQASYDANRRGVRVDGRSRAADVTDSSINIEGGQFRGYTLSAIANNVLKPAGIRLSMKNAPPGAEMPFDSVMVPQGETMFKFIERLARQRDCYVWEGEDGSLNAGLPQGDGSAVLQEGVNILSANCRIEDPTADVVVRGQDIGSDQSSGKQVAQVSARGKVEGAKNNRLHLVLAEEPVNKEEIKMRARREVRELSAMVMQLTVTHQGWLRPGGGWWKFGDNVTVKSPMVIPAGDGSMELQVFNITWSQGEGEGTTTTLLLVTQAAYARMMGASLQPDNFAPGGGPDPQVEPPR